MVSVPTLRFLSQGVSVELPIKFPDNYRNLKVCTYFSMIYLTFFLFLILRAQSGICPKSSAYFFKKNCKEIFQLGLFYERREVRIVGLV